ncbi:MAG: hypothetical protein ACRECU_05525, partial [Methylocella sp.]
MNPMVLNRRWTRLGLQKHLVEKNPVAFAVVSPACVVIHGLLIGRIGRKFGRIAEVMAGAAPIRFRWHDGREIAARPRLEMIGTAGFPCSSS